MKLYLATLALVATLCALAPTVAAQCNSADECDGSTYCDSFKNCYPCGYDPLNLGGDGGCWQYRDPIEGPANPPYPYDVMCPDKCRNDAYECQTHIHCGDGSFCSSEFKCVSCSECDSQTSFLYLTNDCGAYCSQYPAATTTTTTTTTLQCTSHRDCADVDGASQYCDVNNKCKPCQGTASNPRGCWEYQDGLGSFCPSKCPVPELSCASYLDCYFGLTCKDNACIDCRDCAVDDADCLAGCEDAIVPSTTTTTTTITTTTTSITAQSPHESRVPQ
eukprot:m.277044 g.277044  ORF g.277044 m.277044 type:complete len:276 (-) comp15717_c4_seq1:3735-4562(-)